MMKRGVTLCVPTIEAFLAGCWLVLMALPALGQASSEDARAEQLVQPASRDLTVPQGDLERLRALEDRIIRTIESSKKAFVFINGGSGFLISPDGLVLTNDHVVVGRKETTVYLTGGENYRARVLGHDPAGDVALLQIEGAGELPFLELGDSSRLRVGQEVIALGDPFLLASMNLFFGRTPPDHEPSASLGIISALHRYSDTYADAIQVDVAVNRGNSGGPLLTLDGKAVGINGKIETRFAVGINSGVGYAVPSNQVKNFLEPLREAEGGQVSHGVIVGLRVEERAEGRAGLPVREVEAGSPAEEAGFRKGDLIVDIAGSPVFTRNRYRGVLHTFPVGRTIPVRVARDGGTTLLNVDIQPKRRPVLGVDMENGPEGGALVKEVPEGSPAEKAGLKKGDVILSLEGRLVPSVRVLNHLLGRLEVGQKVLLGVVREGKPLQIRLSLLADSET